MHAPLVLLDFGMTEHEPVDNLATALRDAGAQVRVLRIAEPRESKRELLSQLLAFCEAEFSEPPVLAAYGLAANLAMWLARGAKDELRAVLAIGPFMGFDAPMFGCSRRNSTWLPEKMLRMSRMRMLSRTANYLECTRALPGLRASSDARISWGELAACVPYASIDGLLTRVSCPTVIVLDEDSADLDRDRAQNQVLAMNSKLRLSLQSLSHTRPDEVLRRAMQQLDS